MTDIQNRLTVLTWLLGTNMALTLIVAGKLFLTH